MHDRFRELCPFRNTNQQSCRECAGLIRTEQFFPDIMQVRHRQLRIIIQVIHNCLFHRCRLREPGPCYLHFCLLALRADSVDLECIQTVDGQAGKGYFLHSGKRCANKYELVMAFRNFAGCQHAKVKDEAVDTVSWGDKVELQDNLIVLSLDGLVLAFNVCCRRPVFIFGSTEFYGVTIAYDSYIVKRRRASTIADCPVKYVCTNTESCDS